MVVAASSATLIGGASAAGAVGAASNSATSLSARVAVAPSSDSNGYAWVSYFRGLAGLGPVTRNAALEAQDAVHVRYLANSGLSCESNVHDELLTRQGSCGKNPAATAGGKAAANNSNVTRVSAPVTDRQAVSNWFGAAFHSLVLLDPRLQSTGYAAYYTPSPRGAKPMAWPFTAAVDVYRGRTGSYNGSTVSFPANNSVSPLLSYQVGTESPEPFRETRAGSSCHSWGAKAVVSAPIIVQWPIGQAAPQGSATIKDLTAGSTLTTCGLTAGSYPAGSLPAAFLSGANGITKAAFYYSAVPFQPGHSYQLKIGSRTVTTFSAGTVATSPSVTVSAGRSRASVNTVVPGSAARTTRLQVWTSASCSGRLASEVIGANRRVQVTGLTSGRTYSARVAVFGVGSAGRWSRCVAFRPS